MFTWGARAFCAPCASTVDLRDLGARGAVWGRRDPAPRASSCLPASHGRRFLGPHAFRARGSLESVSMEEGRITRTLQPPSHLSSKQQAKERPCPQSSWQLVTVVLGAHDLLSSEPEQQKFTISQVFQNNYNPEENLNDVLLLQLNRTASLGKEVAVASLPQQDQTLSQGTQCLAMGWGRLGTQAPTPRVLQELNVTVVTFLCREHNVCTLVPRRAAGICFGDSGGPLICNGILHGVDSFVIRECASLQFPDFFARVSMYVDWIQNVLRGAEP